MAEPGEEVAEIERELTSLVRRAMRARELHPGSRTVRIDPPSYAVLVRLADDGPQRSGDLARYFGLDKSTVSRQIAALGRAGLVDRAEDPDDGRAAIVALSREGRASLADMRATRRAALRELLCEWPVADRADLARLLGRLNADLGGSP